MTGVNEDTGDRFGDRLRKRKSDGETGPTRSPTPWTLAKPRLTADTMESPLRGNTHGGFGERPGKRTDSDTGTAPQADSTIC